MNRLSYLVLVGLYAAPGLSAAQETHAIVLRGTASGKNCHVQHISTLVVTKKVTSDDGKVLRDQQGIETESLVWRESILEREEGKPPTKVRCVFEKARVTRGGKGIDLSFHDKTVLIVKREGQFRFKVDGEQELPADDVRYLRKVFNNAETLDNPFYLRPQLPKKKVAVNEPWTIDIDYAARNLGLEIDRTKSVGTGKLVKAYERDGRKFGVLEMRMEFAMKDTENADLKIQAGSKITVQQSADLCIDGVVSSGQMKSAIHTILIGVIDLGNNKQGALRASVLQTTEDERQEESTK